MPQPKLMEIQYGEVFTGFYSLRHNEKKDYNGKAYLSLEFGDSSGRVPGVYWEDDALQVHKQLLNHDIVKLEGSMGEWKDRPQVKIRQIRPARPEECVGLKLLPECKIPKEQLAKRLDYYINSVSDEYLSKLLSAIFGDPKFLEKFFSAPAGKLWHGAYIGGLAEHTVDVAKLCDSAAEMFELCRRDILITGALLHDIGKTEELSIGASFDYGVAGRLIGHIVLGERMAIRAIEGIEGFPDNLALEISHLILSHHGSAEMGAPVVPKTLEASILHHADMLEAQANAFSHVIEKELPDGKTFSNWLRPAGRMLFLDPYRESAGRDED